MVSSMEQVYMYGTRAWLGADPKAGLVEHPKLLEDNSFRSMLLRLCAPIKNLVTWPCTG